MSDSDDLARLAAMAMAMDDESSSGSGSGSGSCLDGDHVGPDGEGRSDETVTKAKTTFLSQDARVIRDAAAEIERAMRVGQGETIVEIGIDGDGTTEALTEEELIAAIEKLKRVAHAQLAAAVTLLRSKVMGDGHVAEVLVRALPCEAEFCEIRVAVVGNVDSGKSTLLGVLTRGKLDDGRGLARECVFRHTHEIESGRTSSISQEILGFDAKGSIVNYNFERTPSWSAICVASSKIISFLDLAGHERYLKTTLFGLTGMVPSYAMMMVGANAGVIGMTKEHMGIALALKVPVYMVVTKIDMAPPNVLKRTLRQLSKLVKSPGARKVPIVVRSMDDVTIAARSFLNHRICPIFLVSNVTGENLDLLRAFINLLPARNEWSTLADEPVQYAIDDTFSVPGVGCVVSGTVLSGRISAGSSLLLGPNAFGTFETAVVKSIEVRRHPARTVTAGHSATLALKKIKRSSIRKGMRLIDSSLSPQAVWEFEAEILILYHSTTISRAYEAVIHCGNVRQVGKIISILETSSSVASAEFTDGRTEDEEDTVGLLEEFDPRTAGKANKRPNDVVLRTGMKARVRFRFLYAPEYLPTDARLIFRDGRTKGVGKVVSLSPDALSNKKINRATGGAMRKPGHVADPSNAADSSNSSKLVSSLPSTAKSSGAQTLPTTTGKRKKRKKMVLKEVVVKQ